MGGHWSGYYGGPEPESHNVDTTVDGSKAKDLLQRLCQFPQGFHVHKKLHRFFELRQEMAEGKTTTRLGHG